MKKILIFLSFAVSNLASGQKEYDKGFDIGFSKGYCYNSKISCIAINPPLVPIPLIGEDGNSFQDGYNRGFETGLSFMKAASPESNEIILFNFQNDRFLSYKPFVPREYVPPLDLKILNEVIQQKQALFNKRLKWLQYRINEIFNLNIVLFFNSDMDVVDSSGKKISTVFAENRNNLRGIIDEMNVKQGDLTNGDIFFYYAKELYQCEMGVIALYNSANTP